MRYFSGFCLCDEEKIFKKYLKNNEFFVIGFSKGAQKALEYALNSKKRIDKLILLSPAFFNPNERFVKINLDSFIKDKKSYIKNFLLKAGAEKVYDDFFILNGKKYEICQCIEKELIEMFSFDWNKIKLLKNVKIEVYLGEYDKIIALKKAERFFKNFADVYLIKKANHFLRRKIV